MSQALGPWEACNGPKEEGHYNWGLGCDAGQLDSTVGAAALGLMAQVAPVLCAEVMHMRSLWLDAELGPHATFKQSPFHFVWKNAEPYKAKTPVWVREGLSW